MQSVFETEDSKANSQPGFWQKGAPTPKTWDYEGELKVRIDDKLRPRYFLLARHRLHYCRVCVI